MNKAMLGTLVMGLALLGGCASGVAEQRGTVEIGGGAVRAFAAGPAVVHAFSLDDGGHVFVAMAKTGTDADCAGVAAGTATAVAVDQRNVVTLASGQVACVEATNRRNYELIWHARPVAAPSGMVLIAQARR